MEALLLACLDVDYRAEGIAVAAGVWFRGWTAEREETQAIAGFSEVAPYEPGAFYRRELPCLLGVLRNGPQADLIIVDGYVTLAPGHPGLGVHLHEALERKVPVVGVAKTRYHSATDAIEVRRGQSESPLFVTAIGIEAPAAAEEVLRMHGPYRVPTLLRNVDQLARHGMPDRIEPLQANR